MHIIIIHYSHFQTDRVNTNGVKLLCFECIEILKRVQLLFCKTFDMIASDSKVLIAYYIFSLIAAYF